MVGIGKCGVDEAGRGPILGPLAVGAVMVEDDASLVEMGVRDSKLLTRARRADLYDRIRKVGEIEVVVISHCQIDSMRKKQSLNQIEARAFARVLRRFRDSVLYLDAADVNPHRFGVTVSRMLGFQGEMVCEHNADRNYPVVSAASIIAKETRDRLMDRISEEMGEEIGSGYAHDPRTITFLERWISENGDLPPCARRSWETSRRLLGLHLTSRLTEWTD